MIKLYLLLALSLMIVGGSVAFAEVDFSHPHNVNSPNVCGDKLCTIQKIDKRIFEFVPQENTGNSTRPNYYVEIHLPQTGSLTITGVLSFDNFTALKNNIAVMAVVNIHTVTSPPTLSSYCGVAKYILENQGVPEYLNRIYNTTKNVDLTSLVYPSYCYGEKGNNPINGQGITLVPEFTSYVIVLVMALIISVIMSRRYLSTLSTKN